MPRQYRSRVGEVTAADTKTQLTRLGSEAAPGPLLVPQGVSRLLGILAAAGPDHAAAGSASILVRLEGPGLPEGPEVVTLGAVGYNVATGGHSAMRARWIPLDVPVTPGNEIMVFAEMCGADIGDIWVGVTLVFE